MVKVYELTRFDGMQIKLNWCGQTVTAEFKGGGVRNRAKILTSNLFVQDALEHDPRFGSLFVLTQSFEDKETKAEAEVEEKKKRKITRVKSVNDAMRWLAENGYNPTGDEDLESLMEKAGVEFPNLKK